MKRIFDFFGNVISVFFPKRCIGCGEIISEERLLCDICACEMPIIDSSARCTVCGMHKPHCECKYRVFYFEECVGVFENRDAAKNGYYRYKFGGSRHYSSFFSKHMADTVRNTFKDVTFDAVCPVPQSLTSRFLRGFDHTGLLAKEISQQLDIPFRNDLITCKAFKRAQHKSEYKNRLNNVRGKYSVKKRADGMRILLVDDIRTSGSTLSECSHMLLLGGAESVRCVTALVTVSK